MVTGNAKLKRAKEMRQAKIMHTIITTFENQEVMVIGSQTKAFP